MPAAISWVSKELKSTPTIIGGGETMAQAKPACPKILSGCLTIADDVKALRACALIGSSMNSTLMRLQDGGEMLSVSTSPGGAGRR